ncbi:MAG: AAA family ATPase [Candidatus Spyradocola sp.]|jgi:predicted kinase
MAEVLLLCGKICSGKSTLATRICRDTGALCLSVDELTLALLPERLGDLHDEVTERAKAYLLTQAARIAAAGVSVVLDWGFWTRKDRQDTRAFFRVRGIPCRLFFLDVSPERLSANIAARNARVLAGKTRAYFVDEGLRQKMESRFEPPAQEEVDLVCSGEIPPTV